jgi:ribosomal protein S18 acetylase RimI-like enzyme
MVSNTITIRIARFDDIPVLIRYQQQMAKETEGVTLDPDIVSKGLDQLFNDPSKGKYYVAEVNHVVAGCLMTTFEWSEWRNGTVLWIQSVYVDDAFRNHSVYRTLYEYIKNEVNQDTRLRGVRLYVDRHNARAQEVYRKMGMNGDHYTVFEWMKL